MGIPKLCCADWWSTQKTNNGAPGGTMIIGRIHRGAGMHLWWRTGRLIPLTSGGWILEEREDRANLVGPRFGRQFGFDDRGGFVREFFARDFLERCGGDEAAFDGVFGGFE